ncbi:MAG: ABC transporter substrate-binding protein [Candidatus Korarchaeota archaeon]|nr:ABC transporter substrate-binding protein [Thermoproteota archaeon]
MSNQKVDRRTLIKGALAVAATGIITGVGGYYLGSSSTSALREVVRTVTQSVVITKTVTETTMQQTQVGAQIPTIRVGWVVPTEQLVSLMAIPYIQSNLMKGLNREYKFEQIRFQGTPQAVAALAAGEIDIASLAYESFTRAVINNVVPGGMSIIATDFYDAYEGNFAFQWLTLESSNIRNVKDLRGKTVAVNALGTGVDATLRLMLKKSGLDPYKDVNVVELPFPTHESALREGKIDVGTFPAMFYYRALRNGGVRTVFTSRDAWGTGYVFTFYVARNDFLRKYPAAVRSFLADYTRLSAYLLDSRNREKVIEVVSDYFKIDKELLNSYYLTQKDVYRPPYPYVIPQDLQKAVDTLYELGFIQQRIDVSKYIDNSYLP